MNIFPAFELKTSAWIVESLAHLLWQGTLLALCAAILGGVLRNRSAQTRYLVYCTALFFTAACLPINLWYLTEEGGSVETTPTKQGIAPEQLAPLGADIVLMEDNTDAFPAPEGDMPTDSLVDTEMQPADDVFTLASDWRNASSWILSAYALGILLMACRLLLGLYGTQRLQYSATPVSDSRVLNIVHRLQDQIGRRVIPMVAYSTRVASPVVVGVLKPAILLPASLVTHLSPGQIESLLLHELAHLHRYDHLVNLGQRLVETLLFFHPAVWWLSHKVSTEREHCCDDLAIRWGSEPCDYAESLVRISELRLQAAGVSSESAAVLAATGNGPTQLRQRVLRVLGMPLPGPAVGVTRIGIALLLGIALSCAAIFAAVQEVNERPDLADFDFENPPRAYEKGIEVADSKHHYEVEGLQFQAAPLQWNQEGWLRQDEADRGQGQELFLNLGISGGYEVVTFRLFDHATRKLLHDSDFQKNPSSGDSGNKLFIERIGSTNWVRMKELKDKFPEKIDIWLRIVTSRPGKTLILSPDAEASGSLGDAKFVITSLLEGSMSGKGGPDGEMIWDISSAHDQDSKTTVNFHNQGKTLQGRYHFVAVKKDGSRHPMDDLHFRDFSKMGSHASVVLDVALHDLKHIEMVPFQSRHKFFFNGLEVPRQNSIEETTRDSDIEAGRAAVLAYAKALETGDYQALQKTWKAQHPLDLELAKKIVQQAAESPEAQVDLVHFKPLGKNSIFACLLVTQGGKVVPEFGPMFVHFQRENERWRCSPPGELRTLHGLQKLDARQVGSRSLTQKVIELRFGSESWKSLVSAYRAQIEACELLALPPYELEYYKEAASEARKELKQQEVLLQGIKSKEELWEFIIRELARGEDDEWIPKADDSYLCFYLEADEEDRHFRNIDFADADDSFHAEPFPCLTDGYIIKAKVVEDDYSEFPQIDLQLSEAGGKILGNITKASIGKRLAIVIDGKVLSAPVIRSQIRSNARITGAFKHEEAEAIAEKLNSYQEEAKQVLEDWGKVRKRPLQKTVGRGAPYARQNSELNKVLPNPSEPAYAPAQPVYTPYQGGIPLDFASPTTIDLIQAKGPQRTSASTWIGLTEFSTKELQEKLARALKVSPELKFTIRASEDLPYKEVARLLDDLQEVGMKNFSLERFPPREVLAFQVTDKPMGTVRGKIVSSNGQSTHYNVILIHEDWEGRKEGVPGIIVATDELFEFRNVPVGTCKVGAWPVGPHHPKPLPPQPTTETVVTIWKNQLVDIEIDTTKKIRASPQPIQSDRPPPPLVSAWHKKIPLELGQTIIVDLIVSKGKSSKVPFRATKPNQVAKYLPFKLKLTEDGVEFTAVDTLISIVDDSKVKQTPTLELDSLLGIGYFNGKSPREIMQSFYNLEWAAMRFQEDKKKAVLHQLRNQTLVFTEESKPQFIEFWDSKDLLGVLYLQSFDQESKILKLHYKLAELPEVQ